MINHFASFSRKVDIEHIISDTCYLWDNIMKFIQESREYIHLILHSVSVDGKASIMVSILFDPCRGEGERSKDQEDLLQEQGVQEAHPPQGYPI